MAVEVEELLAVWREAERTLKVLEPGSPTADELKAEVEDLRATYSGLTSDAAPRTVEAIARTRDVIEQTGRTLRAAREHLERA
jgi:chemotaxis regulatin CheY-phosphate phosphatase CheZ